MKNGCIVSVERDRELKSILVTGANGLVGYDVVNRISQNEENLVYASWNKTPIMDVARPIQINLEQDNLSNLNIDFDIIIHCAAVIPSVDNKDQYVGDANRRIDDNVIYYCKERQCTLIYLSAMGRNDNGWITENTDLDIQTNYIKQKSISEEKIKDECNNYFILRTSSPYGIRMKQNNVLNRFVNEAKKGRDLIYYGNGSRTQNFISVSDIALACQCCIDSRNKGVYNIASEEAISMKNLAELIVEHTNHIFNQKICAKSNGNNDLQEEVRTNIDISLAEKKLSWKPEVKIEEGVQQLLSHSINMENN